MGVGGWVCDGRFFVSDLVERVQCFVCDFVTWFGPSLVLICYWHSMRAYTLCTNWGFFFPFIYLNHFFNKENFSCEIIGCYVYLLVVFLLKCIAQEPPSADICTLLLSFVRGCQGGPDPSPPAKYKFLKITL